MTDRTPLQSETTVLSRAQVWGRLGISRITGWRMVRDGDFPAPKRISPGITGWTEAEVAQWLDARPRTQSEAA